VRRQSSVSIDQMTSVSPSFLEAHPPAPLSAPYAGGTGRSAGRLARDVRIEPSIS